MEHLRTEFNLLLTKFTTDTALIDRHWNELARKYSSKKCFYHDLSHLENMLSQLEKVKSSIHDWEALLFALYYHDIVYNVLKSTNEEKSAVLARKRMDELGVPAKTIARAEQHILATKKHALSADPDTNYFLDADLSILGMDKEHYQQYTENIRKEYAIYPDMVYNPGRKKVIARFLAMDTIFKTPYFQTQFESTAKQNLMNELSLL